MLPMFVPRGAFSHLSAAIKEVVDVPVSTVGRINDPLEVRLGESFTAEKIMEMQPDVVILATGADEYMPDIPGIRQKHVLTALEFLKGRMPAGDCCVIIGNGMIGVETAEYLADCGKK